MIERKVAAKFMTRHGTVYYANVETEHGEVPTRTQLEQYAGTFWLYMVDDKYTVYKEDE